MNVASSEACIIDANIIYYIHDITNVPGFLDIIENVYKQVIIHEKVYDELTGPVRSLLMIKLKITYGKSLMRQVFPLHKN